ncbi:hypothetical protein MANES_11G059100v8 [Manihot esculenta]|uniref:Uncharacterized protein n=1 Tax=Manihot esculenta TaxID=3983 RepID=A0A2C9V0T7_MANES|nr:hypothetical protein MANES_11G059100v8 [Manihot esculenta]
MLFSPSLSSLCYFNFDVKLSCFLLWIQHFGNSFSLPSRVPFISCKNYEFLGSMPWMIVLFSLDLEFF